MAGKGDSPRSCYSKQFKDNYDLITWEKKCKSRKPKKCSCISVKTIIKYSK